MNLCLLLLALACADVDPYVLTKAVGAYELSPGAPTARATALVEAGLIHESGLAVQSSILVLDATREPVVVGTVGVSWSYYRIWR